MNQKSTRSLIGLYCQEELQMLSPLMFNNKELCMLLNLHENTKLTKKAAFYLLKEFCISEFFEKWLYKYNSKQAKATERKEKASFYNTNEWKSLRYKVLAAANGKCECCGMSSSMGAVLHVDHIKPRSKYPELALEFSNMQILCADCNIGKSNKDDTDWRDNPYSDFNVNNFLINI